MSLTVQVEGLVDLEAALKELPKRATQKAVVRRALLQAAEPIRSLASALAPDDPKTPPIDLHTSIEEGTKTRSKSGDPQAQPGDVIVYVGPTRISYPIPVEFGTYKNRPQPFLRPAWEARKDKALSELEFYMWSQIDATAQRLARRSAKLAGN